MTQEQIDRERYERLAAASASLPLYGVDVMWLAFVAAVIAALITAGLAFVEVSDNRSGDSRAARDSWLTECQIKGRSLEECASAWDDGSTLRQIYYERVRKGSE